MMTTRHLLTIAIHDGSELNELHPRAGSIDEARPPQLDQDFSLCPVGSPPLVRAAVGSDSGDTMSESRMGPRGWSWWNLLLIVEFVAVLWPPFYNRAKPIWIGMPFFCWYQLLWVIVGAVLTGTVYFAT